MGFDKRPNAFEVEAMRARCEVAEAHVSQCVSSGSEDVQMQQLEIWNLLSLRLRGSYESMV